MATGYILERGLPASMEAERTVLGAILIDNGLYDEAAEFLSDDHFSLDSHRRIWRCMETLRESDRPVDMITLSEELDRRKEVEAVGGVAYLSSLIDGVPERPSILSYVKIVRNKAILRGVINVAQNAIEEAMVHSEEAEEVLSRTEAALLQLTDTITDKGFATIRNSIEETGGLDNYMSRLLDPVAMTGIPTGYTKLDALIGGLQRKTFTVIAARPSQGKSSLVGNICENILRADPDTVIAFFSLEMSKEALFARLLASGARLDVRQVRSGGFVSSEGRGRLVWALEQLVDKNLCIDDSSYLTPIKMRSKCRQLKRRKGRLDLVVADYLQLISGGAKYENREKEISAISRSFKALAKDLDCPVIGVCQLSRAVEGRADKTPMLSDLRESGSIEQDADIVVFVFRASMYDDNPDLEGLAELILAKNREGPTDKVRVAFLRQYTRFENLAAEV
jgi:replicative DNA helicase